MTAIEEIRLIIDDQDSTDFTDPEILHFYNKENSVNYAVYRLCGILIIRLRKQLLEADATGVEQTTLADLQSRLKVLSQIQDEYKNMWKSEDDNSTGRYIATEKPTIAGGDV